MIAPQQKGRRKKCRSCGEYFQAFNTLHRACSPQCALKVTQIDSERRKRKEAREQRQRLKTRSQWLSEAQEAFNAYCRERDKDKPCISCGRHHQGQYHAGHYRTTKANPELRFEELNVHKQCAPCNNHKSGNIVEYRINLRQRIGDKNLEWLEGPHEPKNYTIDEIKEIKQLYKNKLKELKQDD